MRHALALIALLPLLACQPQQEEIVSVGGKQYRADDLAAAAAAKPVNCINLDQVISRRPGGENAITFFMTRGQVYNNKLLDHCPGLERIAETGVVGIHATGSRICSGDRVRVFDPVEAKNMPLTAFPHCRLGTFAPVPIVRVN